MISLSCASNVLALACRTLLSRLWGPRSFLLCIFRSHETVVCCARSCIASGVMIGYVTARLLPTYLVFNYFLASPGYHLSTTYLLPTTYFSLAFSLFTQSPSYHQLHSGNPSLPSFYYLPASLSPCSPPSSLLPSIYIFLMFFTLLLQLIYMVVGSG